MSESNLQSQVSSSTLARKFRKKLRQIENLERLNRPLTEEEFVKVNSKSSIREQLKDILERLDKESVTVPIAASSSGLTEQRDFHQETYISARSSDLGENVSATNETASWSSNIVSEDILPTNSLTAGGAGDHIETINRARQTQDVKTQPKTPSKVNPVKEKKERKAEKGSRQMSKRLCRVTYLEGHSDIITSLVIVKGKVVTASRDTTLKSWDLTTGKELQTFGGHTETVTCVISVDASCSCLIDPQFSPDDNLIISSSFDCTFKMWSLNTGQLLKSVYTFNPLTKICFFLSGKQLITGSDGGKLELWNIVTGENCFSTLAYESSVTDFAVSNEMIYSSSATGLIKVHQVREDGGMACLFESDEVKTVEGKTLTPRHIRCMTKIPSGILFGDDSKNLKLLDWKKGQVRKFPNHTSDFSSTDAVSCHESYILTSSYDLDEGLGYINVRQEESLTYEATLDDRETERITCLDFCLGPDGGVLIVSGGVDLKMWQILPSSGSPARSQDDLLISLEFCQALSISATDSDSESDDESDENDEEVEDGVRGRAEVQGDERSAQLGGIWSWCSVL
ncbi:hypothetical protein RRG08_007552 [Elysia crispata]|uniref:Uncharacterized protein n=1 Tax=Elysia crispata TaxID=231223 RepID=A0AAE0YF39_9GAST|nr:hypothetical protein RRG08_007552 [Elysia crispata]